MDQCSSTEVYAKHINAKISDLKMLNWWSYSKTPESGLATFTSFVIASSRVDSFTKSR